MTDTNELEQGPLSGLSDLTVKLERLIDGDVTCWDIDDVVAYGMKVAAMEREECAKVCDGLEDAFADPAEFSERIRERSNVEISGSPKASPP